MERRLREFKAIHEDLMTSEQKKHCEKLITVTRELFRLYNDKNRSGQNLFHSLQEDIKAFERQVLEATKFQLSDYEAFLWKNKKEKTKHRVLDNFQLLKISSKRKQLPSREELMSLAFPVLSYPTNQLCEIAQQFLAENEFVKSNYKDTEVLKKLVKTMSGEYNIVSYHNFSHAFSVFLLLEQVSFRSKEFKELYSPLEMFVAGVAALAHDLGHMGTNSMYEIKRKTELAIIYNNESVLENMHIAKFYRMLRQNPDLDIIGQIKDPIQREHSKRLIVSLILSTDMAKHHAGLKDVLALMEKGDVDLKVPQHKDMMLELVFHGCDIGNPCMDYDEYMNWSILLSHEFNEQAEREEKENIEVSMFFKYNNLKAFMKGQIGFVGGFTLPLWKTISTIFPGTAELYQSVQNNKKQLQNRV